MALKIRLRQQGRTNRPSFRLVVTQVTSKRDGKYIECLGWYDPFITDAEKRMSINDERLHYWLGVGAQLTESAQSLLKHTSPVVLRQHGEKVAAKRAKVRASSHARRERSAKIAVKA